MMSKHNDPIMELLDMIFSGVEIPHKEETPHEEPPTETKGFESLVSAEEYEAIKELKKALDKYIDVHNKNVMSSIRKIGSFTPYARIQYSILSDVINEVIKSVAIMQGIHVFNKEFIDDMVKENNCNSIEEFERKISLMLAVKKIRD